MSRLFALGVLVATTSEVRRRLDRVNCGASGSARDTRRELDLSDEESVGLVRLSHEDSEDKRERFLRGVNDDETLFFTGSA